MSEETTKRLTIVASIVTILGAIWYFLKGDPTAILQTSVSPGGDVTPVGATPVFNSPASTPISVSVGSGNLYDRSTSVQNWFTSKQNVGDVTATPGGSAGYPGASSAGDYIPTTPGAYLVGDLTMNLGPGLDMSKFLAQAGIESGRAGADISGGCGCDGGQKHGPRSSGGCANTASSALFTDGSGNCLSSTKKRLESSINKCGGKPFDAMKDNMETSIPTIYAGIDTAAYSLLSKTALLDSVPDNFTPPFSFQNWVQ